MCHRVYCRRQNLPYSLHLFHYRKEEHRQVPVPEGRKQYADLQVKDALEKTLNYPPETITKKRNYDDWILWMLYNNHHCKWSDFLEEPLKINQSSLSKNLNLLLDNGYVEKNNREYQITNSGELEYFNMLKKDDLDRQSILDEESKRVEVVTDKVAAFFNEYNIDDNGIKYSTDKHIVVVISENKLEIINHAEALNEPLENYFKPFHTSKKGLGLGLYIVKSILDIHQMELDYQHEDGENIFTVV